MALVLDGSREGKEDCEVPPGNMQIRTRDSAPGAAASSSLSRSPMG